MTLSAVSPLSFPPTGIHNSALYKPHRNYRMSVIEHRPDESRFVLLMDGATAELDYVLSGENNINFTHTFVPPELRGGGRAKKLVDAGLDWARENNKEIEADCWFVQKILKR